MQASTQPLYDLREGEALSALPSQPDAALYFIGRIHTPWKEREKCPRQGRIDGPVCRIEIFEPWAAGLEGIEAFETLEVLYWLHLSRRDIVKQSPKNDGQARGVFSLRSPLRPNPIGLAKVRQERVEGNFVTVRGLDCLDGTPLIDLKPDRCLYSPQVPPKPLEDKS